MFPLETAQRRNRLRVAFKVIPPGGSRSHRERRRRGTRCVTVAVNELELSALIFKGYLPEEDRNDAEAIKAAIEGVINCWVAHLRRATSIYSTPCSPTSAYLAEMTA